MNWVWIDLAALSQLIYQHIANRGILPYKPGGFMEVSSPLNNYYCLFQYKVAYKINDDGEDDNDHDDHGLCSLSTHVLGILLQKRETHGFGANSKSCISVNGNTRKRLPN